MTGDVSVAAALLDLLRYAVGRCPHDVAVAVARQAERARVTRETPGRMLDVEVPDDVDLIPAPDGPLRPIPQVVEVSGEVTGELMVWLRDGRLTGLERPWWTEEAPTGWPTPAQLQFSPTVPGDPR